MASPNEEFRKLSAHLSEVKETPSTALDNKLVESFTTFVVPQLDIQSCGHLVFLLGSLFPTLQQDPTAVTALALKLIERIPTQVLVENLGATALPLEDGLQPEAHPQMHELALTVLEICSGSKQFLSQLAISQRSLFKSLIELWLCTSGVGRAEQASRVLHKMLSTDNNQDTDGLNVLGPVWRTIFHDKDVYGTIYNICSTHDFKSGTSRWPANKQVYPRGRLLAWLPQVAALKWSMFASSQLPEVEGDDGPLLEFAVKEMAGTDDILCHLLWIQFCQNILRETAKADLGIVGLDFLIAHKAHSTLLNTYFKPNDDTISIQLYEIATYVAVYMGEFPNLFIASQQEVQKSMDHLNAKLDMPPSRWQNANVAPDLLVLTALPRKLLADISESNWNRSPLSHLSPKPLNPPAFSALEIIFGGLPPNIPGHDDPLSAFADRNDNSLLDSTRRIYWTYMIHNPDFYTTLISIAKTAAFPERSEAAIRLLHTIVSASPRFTTSLSSSTNSSTPSGPPIAHSSCLPYVLPYLLMPADTSRESYQNSAARFDVLRSLDRLMDERPGDFADRIDNWEEVRVMVRDRARKGVIGRSGVGGDVATIGR